MDVFLFDKKTLNSTRALRSERENKERGKHQEGEARVTVTSRKGERKM